MLRKFQKFIEHQKLADRDGITLIAVSGGIDSVVLCHLYHKSGLPFAMAHCNYKLRGLESDKDERFVEKLAQELKTQCYKIAFDTESISIKEKKSIQLLARDLRYKWFDSLVERHNFSYIATAHHMNDRIETFIYNFTKGTGIKGLRNINTKTGNLIRPLLFASKSDIFQYAKSCNLKYREDQSNASLKYNRNKIRMEVIPVLQKINPALEKTSKETFQHLEDTEAVYNWAIKQHKKDLISTNANQTIIQFQKLKSTVAPKTILYELIQVYGFTKEQAINILDNNTRASGAQFLSKTNRLVINRDQLVIVKRVSEHISPTLISITDKEIDFNHFSININILAEIPRSFSASSKTALLDLEKIEFPLIIRKWQNGDYFHPLGMKGQKQKLKKYLTNEKLSLVEKENVHVLLSKNDIVWVLGMRLDHRFRITEQTSQVLSLEISEKQNS